MLHCQICSCDAAGSKYAIWVLDRMSACACRMLLLSVRLIAATHDHTMVCMCDCVIHHVMLVVILPSSFHASFAQRDSVVSICSATSTHLWFMQIHLTHSKLLYSCKFGTMRALSLSLLMLLLLLIIVVMIITTTTVITAIATIVIILLSLLWWLQGQLSSIDGSRSVPDAHGKDSQTS